MSTQKPKRRINTKYLGIKILIVAFLIAGFAYTQDTTTNSMQLLAVNEDQDGNPQSGSLINLKLTVEPGSGETYVNLDTIEEVDTQISIINSQRIACRLFELPCDRYDFHYEFSGSALLLKGPSASAAIGILVAKTLEGESLDNSTVITGSLNSGGIIGAVGGVETKVEVAKQKGFSKVLIPYSSQFNESAYDGIEVVEVVDLVDAYNNFNGKNYRITTSQQLNDSLYQKNMGELAAQMCQRSNALKDRIDQQSIERNSSQEQLMNQAEESFNSSIEARDNGNFYSAGSFCYNANLNYRTIIEEQKNLSENKRELVLQSLKNRIQKRQVVIEGEEYKADVQTINDFYIYLLLTDRLSEAEEFVTQALKKQDQPTQNLTNSTNSTALNVTPEDTQRQQDRARLFAYASERLFTVDLWEKLMEHSGKDVSFSDTTIHQACERISREVSMKYQLLNQYNIPLFGSDVNEMNRLNKNPDGNKYLCLYQGLELKGRMDTVLNSLGVQQNESSFYINEIIKITKNRVELSSEKNNFPFIPYIYHEYSKELLSQGDSSSALLYSNFALSYADINIYLEDEQRSEAVFNVFMQRLFDEPWFIGGLLIILMLL